MFIAQVLVGPNKQLKPIVQTEHNIVTNPNRLEANLLAIYKHSQRFELGATVKQIQVVVRVGLPDCKSDMLTARPPCILLSYA